MLRKAIHSNYYDNMAFLANGSRTYIMETHLGTFASAVWFCLQLTPVDHCVEILRRVITCYGDTNLITYHWVKDNPVPYPDFNTWHQCRDPEAILAWSKAREAPIDRLMEKKDYSSVYEMDLPP